MVNTRLVRKDDPSKLCTSSKFREIMQFQGIAGGRTVESSGGITPLARLLEGFRERVTYTSTVEATYRFRLNFHFLLVSLMLLPKHQLM